MAISSKRRSRGRSHNLTVPCNNCETDIPYNPNFSDQLCASCETLIAATMAPEYEHSDDEQFESAQEEIIEDEGEEDGDEDGSSTTMLGPMGREFRGEDLDSDVEGAGEAAEEAAEEGAGEAAEEAAEGGAGEGDLFDNTFGTDSATANESGEDEPPAPSQSAFIAIEHTKGCTPSRGPSTPPPEQTRSSFAQLAGPRPPNPHKDLSWNLRRLKRFYVRAKELIPRLPLAEHRYWIGVLNVGKNPDNFKCEKDFIWMKGNRKTTVETIWHMYQQSTATEDFVILFGHETVEYRDCVEELDVFGEKKVIFRAVMKTHPDAKGRDLTEGLVPKDVVSGAKKVHQEVIILDDDDVI